MRRSLVSTFLAEIIQQIHSLRASDVMSSQVASAAEEEARAALKSCGIWCTAPPAVVVLGIGVL